MQSHAPGTTPLSTTPPTPPSQLRPVGAHRAALGPPSLLFEQRNPTQRRPSQLRPVIAPGAGPPSLPVSENFDSGLITSTAVSELQHINSQRDVPKHMCTLAWTRSTSPRQHLLRRIRSLGSTTARGNAVPISEHGQRAAEGIHLLFFLRHLIGEQRLHADDHHDGENQKRTTRGVARASIDSEWLGHGCEH